MKAMYGTVAFGFTFISDCDGCDRPQCFLCGKVLANASMKPAKLRKHLISIHPKNALNSVESFCFKKIYSRKVRLCQSWDLSRHRSLA